MWTGKAKDGCKLWGMIGGEQIATIRAGTDMQGDTDTPDYLRVTSPRAGWTKKSMVALDAAAPPPAEIDPPDFVVAHWADGREKRYVPE